MRDGGEKFAFKVAQMEHTKWHEVVGVLLGTRDPNVMLWLTRIVGYYSFVKNRVGWGWNRSKIAELEDRHKGTYGVPGAVRPEDGGGVIAVNPPLVVMKMNSIRPRSPEEWRDDMTKKGLVAIGS